MNDRQRIVEAKVRLYNSYVNLVSSSWLMWTNCPLFSSIDNSRWRIATHPLSNDNISSLKGEEEERSKEEIIHLQEQIV